MDNNKESIEDIQTPIIEDDCGEKTRMLLREKKIIKKYGSYEKYIDHLEDKLKKKSPVYIDPSLPQKYRTYMRSAMSRKHDFDLPVNYFMKLTEENCFYCGEDGGGVDRINSSVGYIEGNVRPSCTLCNMMKYTHSTDKFLEQVKKIHNNLNL